MNQFLSIPEFETGNDKKNMLEAIQNTTVYVKKKR